MIDGFSFKHLNFKFLKRDKKVYFLEEQLIFEIKNKFKNHSVTKMLQNGVDGSRSNAFCSCFSDCSKNFRKCSKQDLRKI